MLFWKVLFEIMDSCIKLTLTAGLSLCPHEKKASALMCSSVMSVKTNPAGQVHTILLVISGREDESP